MSVYLLTYFTTLSLHR